MGPNLIALAIPLFFLGIGIELAVAKAQGKSVYRAGDAMANMGCGICQQLVGLLATVLTGAGYQWLWTHRLWDIPTNWLPWVVGIFGVEFAYYWWHRLSHEVNILWAAHVVHHQSEDYNLAVALRQSVTTWMTTIPFYFPLALLGVPFFHFAVILGLSTLYQFWIHTALVPPLGFVEKIFNTPALHRVHHAINPRYLDKNHAATFSFLDRLFGTWEPETEPCVYGTTRPLNSYNPLWAQIDGYWELWRLAKLAPTARERFKVFFASPGWRRSWMGEVEKRNFAVRYEPISSRATLHYALGNWGLLLVAVFSFLMWGGSLSAGTKAAVVGCLVLAVASLPALLEGKPWAKPLEAARLLCVPLTLGLIFIQG